MFMQAGTVTVAGYAEAVVDGTIDVTGYGPITVHTRQGQQLGTIAKTTSAAYTQCTSMWTPLVLPVDFVP
jgi:hypothetical protein